MKLIFRKDGVGITFVMLMLLMHDYLFNYVLYGTPLYYLAAWKDICVLFFLSYLVLSILTSFTKYGVLDKNHFLYINLIGVFILTIFLSLDANLLSNFLNFRLYFLLVFFSVFFAWLVSRNFYQNLKVFEVSLVISVVLAVSYGYIQYFVIKIPEDFWYWNHFVNLGFEQYEWNAFRGSMPRVSSFFTSSLDFSLFLLISFTVLLGALLSNFHAKKYLATSLYLFLLLIIVHSIYISTVRSALIGLVSVFLFFLVTLLIKRTSSLSLISILLFISLSGVTFFYLVSGYTEELSALGRVPQWLNFVDLIQNHLFFGLGISEVGINGSYWFDSFWINYFLSFGIVFGCLLVLFFMKVYFNSIVALKDSASKEKYLIYLPLYLITPVFFYLFIFQSFARTPAMYIFLTLFFTAYFLNKKKLNDI